jgi:hypothetical protein
MPTSTTSPFLKALFAKAPAQYGVRTMLEVFTYTLEQST